MIVGAFVGVRGLVAVLAAGVPAHNDVGWEVDAAKTVATVNATFAAGKEEPATAFMVGWSDPLLYLVTAGHVVEDEKGIAATTVMVKLDVSVCGDSMKAKVEDGDRLLDMAVLSVPLPSTCVARIAGVRRAKLSPLLAPAAQARRAAERLVIIGRAPEGGMPPRHGLTVRTWDDARIVFGNYTAQRELSGAPVYSAGGDLVGMVSEGGSAEGWATSFGRIFSRLERVPHDLAGEFSELLLSGYPVGTAFSVDGGAERLAQAAQQVSPAKSAKLKLTAPGYATAATDVELPINGSLQQCVHMVRPIDQKYAAVRRPLVVSTLGVAAIAGLVGWSAIRARQDFDDMPTRDQLETVDQRNWIATGLFTLAGLGAVTLAAGEIFLTPRRESTIDDCRTPDDAAERVAGLK